MNSKLLFFFFLLIINFSEAQNINIKTTPLDAIDESQARLNELLVYDIESDTIAFYKNDFESDTFSMELEVNKKYIFYSQSKGYVTSIRKDTIEIQEADSIFNLYILTNMCTSGFGGICFFKENYKLSDEDMETIKRFNFGIQDMQQDYFLSITIRNKEHKKFQKLLKEFIEMLDKKPDEIRYHTNLHPKEFECITFIMLIKHDVNRKELDDIKARFKL